MEPVYSFATRAVFTGPVSETVETKSIALRSDFSNFFEKKGLLLSLGQKASYVVLEVKSKDSLQQYEILLTRNEYESLNLRQLDAVFAWEKHKKEGSLNAHMTQLIDTAARSVKLWRQGDGMFIATLEGQVAIVMTWWIGLGPGSIRTLRFRSALYAVEETLNRGMGVEALAEQIRLFPDQEISSNAVSPRTGWTALARSIDKQERLVFV